MESLSLDIFHIPAVEIVSQQGMAQRGQMHPYLMSTACFQLQLQQGPALPLANCTIMGNGSLSLSISRTDTLNNALWMPSNRQIYGALRLGHCPLNDGQIAAMEEFASILLGKHILQLWQFGYNYQAGSISIQSMDWMKSRFWPVSR